MASKSWFTTTNRCQSEPGAEAQAAQSELQALLDDVYEAPEVELAFLRVKAWGIRGKGVRQYPQKYPHDVSACGGSR